MMIPVSDKQASDLLFSMYQGHQKMIAARVSAAIGSFWLSMIDPAYFGDTWNRFNPIVRGIIDTHYQMCAADASNYYGLSRAVAGFYGPTVPGSYLGSGYLETLTDKAGKGSFYQHIDSGKTVAVASEMARRGLMGASVRVVLNGGRNTVTNAAAGDNVATGWERIVESSPCAYCAMHAASGGVRKDQSFSFRAHDHCTCLARVVFRGQESANAGLVSDWQRVTAGQNGKAAVKAWDQYWSEKNGSNGNGGGGAEATPASTAEGAGYAPVEDQPVGLA
jgi:hypothetical protein